MTHACKQSKKDLQSVFFGFLFILPVFVILLSLGVWQTQRFYEKKELILKIQNSMKSSAISIEEVEKQFQTLDNLDYQPVFVEGFFIHEGERHFFTTLNGQVGFQIYTPFRLLDERLLLVNRGFVPDYMKSMKKRHEKTNQKKLRIEGLVRKPSYKKPSFLIPDNDIIENIFFWKDYEVMIKTSGLQKSDIFLPFFLDLRGVSETQGWPRGPVTFVDTADRHLQYLFTWYGLAFSCLSIFCLRQKTLFSRIFKKSFS